MTNGKQYDVVIAGYLGIDLVPEFTNHKTYANISEVFIPGKLTEIAGLHFIPGGVVANAGITLKHFNKKVLLNGITGDDFMGKLIHQKLREFEIAEGVKMVSGAATAFGIVIAPPGIDRIFLESPGCNEIFGLDFVDFDAISKSRVMHFGYPPLLQEFFKNSGRQLLDLFGRVNEMQVITSLDLSLPDPDGNSGKCDWPGILKAVLPFTDIFAPSVEELLFTIMRPEYDRALAAAKDKDIIDFIPMETVRKVGQMIIALGAKILLVKMAHRGIYMITGDISRINNKGLKLDESEWNHTELYCKAYPVDQDRYKNASGAGDMAVAGFLSAIIDGNSPEMSLKYTALAGRNNLYSNDIYRETDDWAQMTEDLLASSDIDNPVHCLKSVTINEYKI